MSQNEERDGAQDAQFERMAAEKRRGLIMESVDWLGSNKKWWLLPIVIATVLLGALIMAAGKAGAGAFIYTIF